MDGTEDDAVFQESEDEAEFGCFTTEEREDAAEVAANVAGPTEPTELPEESSEEDDDEYVLSLEPRTLKVNHIMSIRS